MGGVLPTARANGGGGARGAFYYNADNGLYFGNQFLMGDGEFPRMDPESFLFGEMGDLNHLSRVPGMLARPPSNIKHTNTVRSLLSLHKDSIRLVYHADDKNENAESNPAGTSNAHIEFTFDCDVPCSVTVHFAVSESTDVHGVTEYSAKHTWPARRFNAGLFQQYSFPAATVDFADFAEEDLFVDQCGPRKYPLIIDIQALVDHPKPHAHATFATFDRSGEGVQAMTCKPIIQRLSVDGLTFILKEIYGIENKEESGGGRDDDDNSECVVCMSDIRDTMALPCRHLCLCNPCAEVLRYQNNKCPICRTVFHSLLQIRVLRDKESINEEDRDPDESEDEETAEKVPPGFGLVSLVSALTNSESDPVEDGEARADEADVVAARASVERVPILEAGSALMNGSKESADLVAIADNGYTANLVPGKGKARASASPSNVVHPLELQDTVVANTRDGRVSSPGTPDTDSGADDLSL